MKVLVCGGRHYGNKFRVYATLNELAPDIVVHGAASGADHLAGCWAREHGCEERSYPADWDKHGRAAGPIRNKQMLECEKPDVVVAFAGGKGTASMMRLARAAGVAVREIVD